MTRYTLRTLMIVLAMGSPMLAGAWWSWPTMRDTLWPPPPQTAKSAPFDSTQSMPGGMFAPPSHLPYWWGEGDPPPGYEKGNMANEP